jgi:hypothetical protein
MEVMGILIDCSQIFGTLDQPKFIRWVSYFINLLKLTLQSPRKSVNPRFLSTIIESSVAPTNTAVNGAK